jgi:hypothetical protein
MNDLLDILNPAKTLVLARNPFWEPLCTGTVPDGCNASGREPFHDFLELDPALGHRGENLGTHRSNCLSSDRVTAGRMVPGADGAPLALDVYPADPPESRSLDLRLARHNPHPITRLAETVPEWPSLANRTSSEWGINTLEPRRLTRRRWHHVLIQAQEFRRAQDWAH